MGSLIRLARTEGINLPVGDDGDFVIVREELTKKERNALIKKMPDRANIGETGMTVAEGVEFQNDLFEALVLGWSADMEASVENYLALPPAATDAIDEVLAKHFADMVPSKEEQGKE